MPLDDKVVLYEVIGTFSVRYTKGGAHKRAHTNTKHTQGDAQTPNQETSIFPHAYSFGSFSFVYIENEVFFGNQTNKNMIKTDTWHDTALSVLVHNQHTDLGTVQAKDFGI